MAKLLSSRILAVPALLELAELANINQMTDLERKFAHYRQRFVAAFKARAYTNEGFAEKIGAHPVTVSKLRSGTIKLDDEWRMKVAAGLNISEETLFGSDPLPAPLAGEIYVSPKKAAKRGARLHAPANDNIEIPLYGLAAGSQVGAEHFPGDFVEHVPCPPALMNVVGAYALKTTGESMKPRYNPGERVYVNPHQKIRVGDHVIIQVQRYDGAGTETWIKRFNAETAESYFVSQYNPPTQIEFKKRFVLHIHRVVPLEELFG